MSTDIERMQRDNENYRQQVSMGEVAKRLKDNKDFQALILDFYCVKECARYAQVSGDVSLPAESRQDALANAQAAGYLKRFLHTTIQMGEMAARSIGENEQEIIRVQSGTDED